MNRSPRHRAGSSFLEIQVALVVLGIALAGLCPLVVMQSRVLRRIESGDLGAARGQTIQGYRMVDGQVYGPDSPPAYLLVPNSDPWVRRLGVAATIGTAIPTRIDPVFQADDSSTEQPGWVVEAQPASSAFQGSYQVRSPGVINPTPFAWPALVAKVPGFYGVFVTWPPNASNAKKATYSLARNSSPVGSVVEDQSRTPAGVTLDLRPWQDLGLSVFLDAGDQLWISLDAPATDRVVADGVMIANASKRQAVTVSSPLAAAGGSASVTVNVGANP